MSIDWSDILFVPDDQLAAETAAAWRWLIPEPWKAIACSMFGGLFLEKALGEVFWLECGTGLVERGADNTEDSARSSRPSGAPGGSSRSRNGSSPAWSRNCTRPERYRAGPVLRPGPPADLRGRQIRCRQRFVVSAREWLTVTGSIHQQMVGVADGAHVHMKLANWSAKYAVQPPSELATRHVQAAEMVIEKANRLVE